MHSTPRAMFHSRVLITASLLLISPTLAVSQNSAKPPSTEPAPDLETLAALVLQLQSQVHALNSQMSELRTAQQQAARDGEELRAELDRTKQQLAAGISGAYTPSVAPAATTETQGTSSSLEERVSQLEGDRDLMNDKIGEQSQTKVESGSKYRVRLSGIVLLNTAVTRGSVDNLDFPQIATPPETPGTSGAFSGSLRQSQMEVEAFGPDVAGARTSANVTFDFAGGFPNIPNGATFGFMRLRTGTIRFDWDNTSIVVGQDSLFFAPLTPTTLSSLAIPALSYTGNLWSWTPQVRIEHRVTLSETFKVLFQAGLLDSLTGDVPQQDYRYPTAGEQSGQPAYASRIALSRRAFGRDLTVGFGGYYGRQNWGFGRNLDGWAGTTDVTLPLGTLFALDGEFYRGRGLGGFGGGIGRSLLLTGPLTDPGTTIHGLDSMGGWIQLKFKPKANFEVNFAYGQDNPFAGELRFFPASANYYGSSLSRNLSPFVNFVYRVRSDLLFSGQYQRLQTYTLDSNPSIANQVSLSLGYIF